MLRFFKIKPETAITLVNLGVQSVVLGYFASQSTQKNKGEAPKASSATEAHPNNSTSSPSGNAPR